MNETEIRELVERQRSYFLTGATLPVEARIEALKKLKACIQEHEQEINEALKADLGKGAFESYMCETGLVLSELTYMIKNTPEYAKEITVRTPLAQFASRSYQKPSPYGVVLIMSPWNYPFLLSIDPLVDAIAAGNTAVIKPSAYSPNTGRVIDRIISLCFDRSHAAVVTGGREENTSLLNEHFDYIFFTGSQHVGREVMTKAARHLTPVTLELGGKSPCIVDRGADVETAARRIAWGKTLNAGQTCIAPDYLLLHESLADAFPAAYARALRRLHGDDARQSPHYVRLVNDRAFDRVASYLAQGTVRLGGRTDRAERYIEPTLLTEVDPLAPVMREEIFGPVLPVVPFRTTDEAVAFVTEREKPLALYYFGPEKSGREVLRRTSSGGACLNDTIMHIANEHLPFGGVGNSGMGRYHDRDSFDAFSHRRAVVETPTWIDPPFRYMPYKLFRYVKRIL